MTDPTWAVEYMDNYVGQIELKREVVRLRAWLWKIMNQDAGLAAVEADCRLALRGEVPPRGLWNKHAELGIVPDAPK